MCSVALASDMARAYPGEHSTLRLDADEHIVSLLPAQGWVAVYRNIGDENDLYHVCPIAAWALGEMRGRQFVRPLIPINPEDVGGLGLGSEKDFPDGSGLSAYFPSEAAAIAYINLEVSRIKPTKPQLIVMPDFSEVPVENERQAQHFGTDAAARSLRHAAAIAADYDSKVGS